MWHDAKNDLPATGWYLCMLACSGRFGCGSKCSDMYLMRYDAILKTAVVYGSKCMFHGNALYDVPLGDADEHKCGVVTHWQELPERP